MKIRKLKIKNYKMFEDIEFDFTDKNGKTLDTVIFAGINGTGKTSLLEFIMKIFTDINHYAYEDIDKVELELYKNERNLIVESQYYSDNDIKKYMIFKGNERKYMDNEIYSITEILSDKNNFKISYFHNNVFSDKKKFFQNSDVFFKYIDYENFEKDLQKYFDDVIYKYILKNRNLTANQVIEKRIKEINNFLKELKITTKIVDIEDNKLILENISGKKLEIKDLSDGEKQIYFRAIFFNTLNLENSLIFVDEPELSLHPQWQSLAVNFYQNAGNDNQVFLATHSPHIIGKVPPESVFLLKYENNKIIVENAKYTKGHSISYILSEIMETNYKDTFINETVNKLLKLIRKGKHKTEEGKKLLKEINELSPESEERIKVNFSMKRYEAIGR